MLTESSLIGFIPSSNFEASEHFYGEVLGLELLSSDDFALVFRAGRNMLRVVQANDFTAQKFTVLGWEVENLPAAVQRLKNRGVSFVRYPFLEQDELGVWKSPTGDKVAWFKDPDDNVLSLSQHVQTVA